MCKGMEEYTLKVKVEATISAYRDTGMSNDGIVKAIVEKFQVTADYVKSLMEIKPA